MPSRQGRPSPQEADQRRWATLKVLMPREVYDEVRGAIEVAKRLGVDIGNDVEALRMICAEFLAGWLHIAEHEMATDDPYRILVNSVYERDNWECLMCGTRYNLTPHHVLPRAHGGEHVSGNLATLCVRCHNGVTEGDAEHNWKAVMSQLREKIDENIASGSTG